MNSGAEPTTKERIPGAPFGVVVRDFDFAEGAVDERVHEVRTLVHRQRLVLFRGHRKPSDEEYERFASRFAPLFVNDIAPQFTRPGHPSIVVISNIVAEGQSVGAQGSDALDWHADMAWQERVAKYGWLEAMEVPPVGGNTLFADMYAAYAEMPQWLRDRIGGLRARYAATGYKDDSRQTQSGYVHDLVIRHPDTGDRAVYAGSSMTQEIVGVPEDEGRRLLEQIFSFTTRRRFVYEHVWQHGDLVMWDEIGLLHSRSALEPTARRYMRQITGLVEDPAAPWTN